MGTERMGLPVLPLSGHGDCTSCARHENSMSVGMPTTLFAKANPDKRKAVLVVGESPGYYENQDGRAFTGPSGNFFRVMYYDLMSLGDYCDVYVQNAVRCYGGDRSVIPTQVKACKPHLEEDLQALSESYDEVVLFLVSPTACLSVIGQKTPLGKFRQGTLCQVGSREHRVFYTNNPGILQPHKNPSAITSIIEHLILLLGYLKSGELRGLVEIPPRHETTPKKGDSLAGIGVVAYDIETYGCLGKQSTFHPRKMESLDGVRPEDIVVCAALSWRTEKGLKSRFYNLTKQGDKQALLSMLATADAGTFLQGKNLAFDILCSRHAIPGMKAVLNPATFRLSELAVTSFLDSPDREEKTLKSLSALLGVSYYAELKDFKKGQYFQAADDEDLRKYNIEDTLASLLCQEVIEEGVRLKYGDDTCLRDYSRDWFSDLNWECVLLAEDGVAVDVPKLTELHERYQKAFAFVNDRLVKKGKPLTGKGSEEVTYALFEEAAHAISGGLGDNERDNFNSLLEMTEGGRVSRSDANLSLLLGYSKGELRSRFTGYRRLKKFQKMMGYTGPLTGLTGRNDSTQIGGIVYPVYYPVPSYESDSSKRKGGTRQGRITCQSPARQTHPEQIAACERSRFPDGARVIYDASQIEYRMAAILARDPAMIEIFKSGANLHALSGSMLAGFEIDKKKHKATWYAAGKMANFLRLFGGEADKLQHSLLSMLGLEVPLSQCRGFLAADKKKFPVFYAWQEQLYRTACETGRLTFPLVGISRNFLGSDLEPMRATIYNMLIQTGAALFVQSVQTAMRKWLRETKKSSILTGNIYDSLSTESPASEVLPVACKFRELFIMPPLYRDLIEQEGFIEIPLASEGIVVYNDGRVLNDKALLERESAYDSNNSAARAKNTSPRTASGIRDRRTRLVV